MAKKDVNKEKNKNNFFKELKSELKKVTWPTFKKLVNNTSAVIAIVLIVCAIVFVLDVCFENLNGLGIERLKKMVSSDTENVDEVEDGTDGTIDLTNAVQIDSNDEIPSEENNESENDANADSGEQTENNSGAEEVQE